MKRGNAEDKGREERRAAVQESGFPNWVLISSYLLAAIVFFFPALLPGRMMFGSDYVAGAFFFEEFATDRFQSAALPLWLPTVYGGVPFFANPMDVYYPISVLLRLAQVPTHEHLGILFVAQFFLAGVGVYLLLREMGARQWAAHLAGLAYMFSGYLISNIYAGHDGRAIVATLAPLLLFSLHRGFRTGALRWFVAAGIVSGSVLLSFQIQTTYYLALAALAWSAFLLWHFRLFRPLPVLARRVGGGLVAIAIALALSSVNLLPFLGYIDASPRGGEGGRGYEYSVGWSMPLEETVGIAVPERIGVLDAYWGDNAFKLHTEYVGGLVVALLILSLYLPGRRRYTWFYLGTALFFLTIAFGGHTPLYRVWYAILPGTSKFRAPSISFYLVVLSLTILAGLALDRLADLRAELSQRAKGARFADRPANEVLRGLTYLGAAALAAIVFWAVIVSATPPPAPGAPGLTAEAVRSVKAAQNHGAYALGIWRFALFMGLSLVVLWGWLERRISSRVTLAFLGVLTLADLWLIDKKFFETIPGPSTYFAADEVASFLSGQPGPFRTFVLFDLPQDNYLTHFGIELVGGEHGNQLQTYNEFLGAGEQTYTDYHNMGYPIFLALANVKYIVTGQEIGAPFLEPVFSGRTRRGQSATVFENSAVLPRAFLAASGVRVSGPDGALERMRSANFDPTREVLLYEEPPLTLDAAEPLEGSARITRHESAQVDVEVSVNRPAYLVLTDNYYPDWRVEVDGEEARLLRANHTFRAVPVPAGDHAVVFRFEPASLRVGFIFYVITWVALASYGLVLMYIAKRKRSVER
jgi:hypothetical protein